MLRIIHLSDLHIHKSMANPDNQMAKALVKDLCNRFGSSAKSVEEFCGAT